MVDISFHDREQTVPRDLAAGKRAFDITVALALLGVLVPLAAVLLVLNPLFNRGPLLLRQDRMGYRCARFGAYKFRTMRPANTGRARGAFDPLETDRITPLGRVLRRLRLDELPQIINVLRGEMSLIGPRPDAYDHACIYLRQMPAYRARHAVRPGISGYAQTHIGYVDDRQGVERKLAADLHYIANGSVWLEAWIFWRTLVVVCARAGQ